MNKKEYKKPIAKQIIIANESLLTVSGGESYDPNVATATLNYKGDDKGNAEAESKRNHWVWDDEEE